MEEVRYCVSMKKGYKIFYYIFSLFIFISGIVGLLSITIEPSNLNEFLTGSIISIVFCIFGIASFLETRKKITIYKGGIIIYCNRIVNKKYKFSDIKRINETTISSDGDVSIGYAGSYDKVINFYNHEGKKLFSFGLAYEEENLKRFIKEVQNVIKTQKI